MQEEGNEESLRVHLPAYLSTAQRESLYKDLNQFPALKRYYWKASDSHPLQGDCLRNAPFVYRDESSSLQERPARSIVVSNSCDISPNNKRVLPVNALIAPIFRFGTVLSRLKSAGRSEQQISEFETNARSQKITSYFYLPSSGTMEEGLVPLDLIRSEEVRFLDFSEGNRLTSLSQSGFYLFLTKLSVHLMRVGENVARYD